MCKNWKLRNILQTHANTSFYHYTYHHRMPILIIEATEIRFVAMIPLTQITKIATKTIQHVRIKYVKMELKPF